MANGWTSERRSWQAQLIHKWRPWERSTGPRTPEGKARVSRNADKGGLRATLIKLRCTLREQEKVRCRLVKYRHRRGQDALLSTLALQAHITEFAANADGSNARSRADSFQPPLGQLDY